VWRVAWRQCSRSCPSGAAQAGVSVNENTLCPPPNAVFFKGRKRGRAGDIGRASGTFCGKAPRADRAKCRVSPHLPQIARRDAPPWPQCSGSRRRRLLGKEGVGSRASGLAQGGPIHITGNACGKCAPRALMGSRRSCGPLAIRAPTRPGAHLPDPQTHKRRLAVNAPSRSQLLHDRLVVGVHSLRRPQPRLPGAKCQVEVGLRPTGQQVTRHEPDERALRHGPHLMRLLLGG